MTRIFPDGNVAGGGGGPDRPDDDRDDREDRVAMVGDQLAGVNGRSAVGMKVDDVCGAISSAHDPDEIELTLLRYVGELRAPGGTEGFEVAEESLGSLSLSEDESSRNGSQIWARARRGPPVTKGPWGTHGSIMEIVPETNEEDSLNATRFLRNAAVRPDRPSTGGLELTSPVGLVHIDQMDPERRSGMFASTTRDPSPSVPSARADPGGKGKSNRSSQKEKARAKPKKLFGIFGKNKKRC